MSIAPDAPTLPHHSPIEPPHPTSSRRVAVALVTGGLGWALPTLGAQTTLLPALVAVIAPVDKFIVLGGLATVGALTALVFGVIFGALSDLTRTRFGGRTPWIVGGGVLSALFMVLLANARSVWELYLYWILFQATVNMITPALLALIPDRVALLKRGSASSAYGVGVLGSAAVGSIIGAQFIATPATGLLIFAAVILVLPLVAVTIAPDRGNADAPRPPMNVTGILSSFSFPRKAADFYWAFYGRLALNLGASMVGTYQLYIISDYIHLNTGETTALISAGSGLNFLLSLISSAVAGPIADKIKRFKLPVVGAGVIFVIAILIPFFFPSVPAMLVYFALAGIGYGIYFSVDAALMTAVLPSSDSFGKDLGILNVANVGGAVVAPAISSGVIALGLGFPPVFLAAAALALVGAVIILPIKSVK